MARILLYKTGRFRSGGPGLVMAKRILSGSKPVCQNHRARFLAGRNQPSTSFSLSDSAAFFHRRPGSYFAKPVRIRFGSDCVRFWPKGSGPEASRCEESSGPLLANASEPIRIGCELDPALLGRRNRGAAGVAARTSQHPAGSCGCMQQRQLH